MVSNRVACYLPAALAVVLCGAAARNTEAANLVLLAGSPQLVTLQSLQAGKATFRDTAEEQITFAFEQVVRWGSLSSQRNTDQVLLTDGSILIGRVTRMAADQLELTTSLWDELRIRRELIKAVIWQFPTTQRRRWQLYDILRAAPDDRDRLVFAHRDELQGTVMGFDGALQFIAGGERVSLGTERIAGWKNRNVRLQESPRAQVLGFRDGTKLCAAALQLGNRAEATLVCGLRLLSLPDRNPVEEDLVVYWRPGHENVVYLSDLPPVGHKHIPYLNQDSRWNWSADRNVLGGPLCCGGQRFDKGIGMHSTSRLAFELDGEPQELQAEICVDASSGSRGSVIFRVFSTADGASWEERFQSDVVRGGGPLVPIRVPLGSARRLALVVDFADAAHVLDRANWIGARLVKRKPPNATR